MSTDQQTVENQRQELLEHAATRGWQVVAEYSDEGISGSRASRPALDRLLHGARRRQFDAVVVWKLDRLGRSLRHLLELVDKLKAIGVGLASLRDPGFDTTTPQGELVFHVLAAVGQFERELIRERIRAGLARAKRCPRKGKKRPGRPRRVRLDLDAARRMIAEGKPLAAVARQLRVSRGALRYRLEVDLRRSHSDLNRSAIIDYVDS